MWYSTREAYRDDNDVMYCDECGISENEADVNYEEDFDKDLCDECCSEKEREWEEHQHFQRWLKEQNAPRPEPEPDYTGIRSIPIL